jgi:hypothetical protein
MLNLVYMEEAIKSELHVKDKRYYLPNADEQVFSPHTVTLPTRNADKIHLFQLHFLRA